MKIIKKGQEYLCTKDYLMEDGDLAYKKGDVYKSDADYNLPSIVHKHHTMYRDEEFKDYFKKCKNKIVISKAEETHIKELPVIFERVESDSIVDAVNSLKVRIIIQIIE